MKLSNVVVFVLVALVVGAGVGYTIGERHGARTRQQEMRPDSPGARDLAELRTTNRKLLEKLRAVTAKRQSTGEMSPAAGSGKAASSRSSSHAAEAPASGVKTVPAGGARFFATDYGGALAKLDWKTIGKNAREIVGLIPKFVAPLSKGKFPSGDVVGRLQQLNGPLLTAALSLGKDVPGSGVAGKFTSPAFMANAIAAVLAAGGQPLTAEESRRIEVLSRQYIDADSRRLQDYTDATWALTKLMDEATLKERYFEDVFAGLNSDQLALLRAPEASDRVSLDIFSAAIVYQGHASPLVFSGTDDLVAKVVNKAAAGLTLTDAQRQSLQPLVAEWAATLPKDLLGQSWNGLDAHGMLTVSRITAWGRQNLALLKSMDTQLSLSDSQKAMIRQTQAVTVLLDSQHQQK